MVAEHLGSTSTRLEQRDGVAGRILRPPGTGLRPSGIACPAPPGQPCEAGRRMQVEGKAQHLRIGLDGCVDVRDDISDADRAHGSTPSIGDLLKASDEAAVRLRYGPVKAQAIFARGAPVTDRKAKGRTANRVSDLAQAPVTEIVTHVPQHDAIGRKMALRQPCSFDIAC